MATCDEFPEFFFGLRMETFLGIILIGQMNQRVLKLQQLILALLKKPKIGQSPILEKNSSLSKW